MRKNQQLFCYRCRKRDSGYAKTNLPTHFDIHTACALNTTLCTDLRVCSSMLLLSHRAEEPAHVCLTVYSIPKNRHTLAMVVLLQLCLSQPSRFINRLSWL